MTFCLRLTIPYSYSLGQKFMSVNLRKKKLMNFSPANNFMSSSISIVVHKIRNY